MKHLKITAGLIAVLLLAVQPPGGFAQQTNLVSPGSKRHASLDLLAPGLRKELAQRTNLLSNVYAWNAETWRTNKDWLEAKYASLGYSLELLYRSEFGIFCLGLEFATLSDDDFAAEEKGRLRGIAIAKLPPEVLSKVGPNRMLSRDEFLANWVTNQFNLAPIAFDKDKWRQAATARDWTRYRLFKGFVAANKIEGISADQLEQLLGPPDEKGAADVRYTMGPELQSISLDYSVLEFKIADGKVKDWRIINR